MITLLTWRVLVLIKKPVKPRKFSNLNFGGSLEFGGGFEVIAEGVLDEVLRLKESVLLDAQNGLWMTFMFSLIEALVFLLPRYSSVIELCYRRLS